MSWKNPPSNYAIQILKDGDEHLRKVATAALQEVIVRSPVDQGAFRANHRVSISTPDNSADPNKKDKSGTTTLSEGAREILKAKLGTNVFIQNNLAYGLKLENGHSDQAPKGIYALTFQYISSKYK